MNRLNETILQEMNKYLDGTTIEEILLANRKLFRYPPFYLTYMYIYHTVYLVSGNRSGLAVRPWSTETAWGSRATFFALYLLKRGFVIG